MEKKESIASIEQLTNEVDRLSKENAVLQREVSLVQCLNGLDEFTKTILLDKIARITEKSSPAELKEFIDYLDIFEKYRAFVRK
jgi:hypothetical protein